MPYMTEEKLITDEIKKLIPVLGKETAQRLSKAYLLADEDMRKRIIEMVDVIKAAVFSDEALRDTLLMEPPPQNIAEQGELELGKVLYGKKELYNANISQQSLLMHVGIFGSSGYGKTNISYDLIKQISDMGIPVLIFDFSKRNYKDLINTELKERIEIYTIGRNASPFRFNPLYPPPGIELSQWMKEFASIFDHAYWLLGGGRHIIFKTFNKLAEKMKEEIPRLKHLKDYVNSYASAGVGSRERNWISTAQRPLESLCFRELGEVFDCDIGVTPLSFFEKLPNSDKGKITVLELDALDVNDKTFFIEIIMQWMRDWLIERDEREKLFGTIILEEAHHVLNREKSSKLGSETVIDLVFREVRELGLGVIYLDQHPSLVSYPALGNTSTHIYMNLGLDTKHASDILDASNMLGLDYDEQGVFLRKLPIGQGFVLQRQSEFPNPYLVKFPLFNIKKGFVKDSDISALMQNKIEKMYAQTKQLVEGQENIEVKEEDISEQEWKIIETLATGKGITTSQIYNAIGMSGSTFSEKAELLKQKGLLSSKNVKVGKQTATYHFLTNAGINISQEKYKPSNKIAQISNQTIDNLNQIFSLNGWKKLASDHEDIILYEKDGKKVIIAKLSTTNSEEIKDKLRKCRYFLCANDTIKNLLLQQAAQFSATTHESDQGFVIFVSTEDEFEKRGTFEKVTFSA